VTIKDIAREVGMSFSSVSRILRGSKRFKEETVRKVCQKAKELRYRPNLMARALVKSGSSLIGLVVTDIQVSFFADIIAGVQEDLEAKGYSIILANSKSDVAVEKNQLRVLIDKQVEGVIIIPVTTGPANRTLYNEVLGLGVPLVMVGEAKVGVRAPSVRVNNVLGGYMAAQHLLDLGHRDIVYMTHKKHELDHHGKTSTTENIERYTGLCQAMKDRDAGRPRLVVEAPEQRVGDSVVDKILALRPLPTAIFAYSDAIAIQTIRLLEKRGYKVPADFSVVGYDDMEVASLFQPPLTTIAQPKVEMGKLAAEKLLRMLDGGDAGEKVILPELVVRESTTVCRSN
jgi:DNA-binding LacI/PurR family transcriptional regulator